MTVKIIMITLMIMKKIKKIISLTYPIAMLHPRSPRWWPNQTLFNNQTISPYSATMKVYSHPIIEITIKTKIRCRLFPLWIIIILRNPNLTGKESWKGGNKKFSLIGTPSKINTWEWVRIGSSKTLRSKGIQAVRRLKSLVTIPPFLDK